MMRATLADMLTALAEGVAPDHPEMTVEEAEISLPVLVRVERGPNGPVVLAQPPFSAYRAGFEPVAHRARLRFGLVPDAPARPAPEGADPATRTATDNAG